MGKFLEAKRAAKREETDRGTQRGRVVYIIDLLCKSESEGSLEGRDVAFRCKGHALKAVSYNGAIIGHAEAGVLADREA